MQDKKKELARNTVILTIGKICTQFISFMLLPLYTALLEPKEFGIVDLLNTYISLLVPIFNWQFDSGLFRFMIENRNREDNQKKIFSTVIISNVFQAIIYLAFYFIVQGYIGSKYKIFLAINVVLSIFLSTLLQLPRALGDNISYSIASFVSATSAVLLNVIFIAGMKLGAYGMFYATVLSNIITIIYITIALKTWKYFSISSFDRKVLKNISKYSVPLIPNQLSWWVVSASDRSIVSYFIGVMANGIYSVANKFSSVYITFYNIFNLSWTESVTINFKEDGADLTNNIEFKVDWAYPGMETYEKKVSITNAGQLKASLKYEITYAKIFDEEYSNENYSSDEIIKILDTKYPFKITFTIDNQSIETGQTANFGFKLSWPYESGNDELDTTYGKKAAAYKESGNIKSEIEIRALVTAAQTN